MSSSRQRTLRKARAASRNAVRAAENAAALAISAAEELAGKIDGLRAQAADMRLWGKALTEPRLRDERRAYLREARRLDQVAKEAGERDAGLRRQRAALATAQASERQRAAYLLRPLTDPPPDAEVIALQTRAEAQRTLAAKLDAKADVDLTKIDDQAARRWAAKEQFRARRERKVYRDEARRLDAQAAQKREAQLVAHRQAMDGRETAAQARARGVELEDVGTETPDWVRDEHGAIVRDDRGLPVMNVEKSTTRRQKHGLDWMLTKGKISPEQYRTGRSAERVWADAAQAAEPGRAESGQPGVRTCLPSPGPADWRMEAMQRAKRMEAAITSLMAGEDGAAIVATCRSVCFEGLTTQRLAEDRYGQVRHEERLKLGLSLIGYWLRCEGEPRRAA